jgi:predicted ATP-grasp superfamily ATP-dependent carboligase
LAPGGESGSKGHVLVTEGENRGVLAACRSLSRDGYMVAAASGQKPAVAFWSRACHSSLALADPGESPVRFVVELEALLRGDRFDVLVPGGDRSLHLISEARGSLGRHVELGLPDRRAVQRSLDKVALLDAAEAARLPPPTTHVCTSVSDARRALHSLGLPAVVKPSRSAVESAGSLRQQPVWIVTDPYELERLPVPMSLPFLVQRYEREADRLSCGGVMTAEGIVGFVVIRFLRTWPPLAGAVCFGETIRSPRGLREQVEHLLDLAGWRGIFELELLDLGRGRLAAIDLNPRLFGWLALAIAAGADLPRIWLESLAGAGPRAIEPLLGVRYRWEDAELAHFLWQVRRRRIGAAADVVRPHRHVVHAHFRLEDPAPLAARLLRLAQRRTRVG